LLSAAHYLCAAYSLRFNNLQSPIFNLQSSIVSLPGRSSGSPQPVIPSRRVVVSGVILTSSFNFQNLRSPIFNFQSSISKKLGDYSCRNSSGVSPDSLTSRQHPLSDCQAFLFFIFLFFLFFYFSKDLAFMPFAAAKLQSFLLFFAFFIFFILFQFSIFIFFSGSKFFTLHSSLFIFFSLH
jgi:hypothetical protein